MDKIDIAISRDVKRVFHNSHKKKSINYLKILTITSFFLILSIPILFLINKPSVVGYVVNDVKNLNQCILDKNSLVYLKEPMSCYYQGYENNFFMLNIQNNLDKPILIKSISVNDCVEYPNEIVKVRDSSEFSIKCIDLRLTNPISIEYGDSETGLVYAITGKLINV